MDPSFPNNNANVPAPAQPVGVIPVGAPNGEMQAQQPQQQQPLMPNVGAANAVQQALAAFQASVEAAAVAAAASNPAAAATPQAQQQPPQQQPMLTLQPAAAPTMMPAPGAALFPGTTAEAQQQLWQQAWLSAILPAQQAALTQPYLAAALNPLQQQQQAQQPAPQQPQPVMTTMPPAPISTVPTTADMAAAAAASAPPSSKATKRKANDASASTTSRPTKKQQQQGGPSVISATSSSPHMLDADAKPPAPKTEAELAVMTPAERRRYERNLREQQRSYKISQQIKQLRDVLHESNIPFRPNKYSILVSVADYIKQLQSRAIMLDSEHQRLIDTIRNTTERVNNESNTSAHPTTTVLEADAPLVQGIDYQSVFRHCYFPLAVATLDGRVLRCNTAMERLLRAAPLADQSFFVFIRNHQEVFEAMAALLKRSTATIETGEGTVTRTGQLLFWCGHILSPSNETFPFTITLTNDAADNPKYFSLSAAASPEI